MKNMIFDFNLILETLHFGIICVVWYALKYFSLRKRTRQYNCVALYMCILLSSHIRELQSIKIKQCNETCI